MTGGAGAEPPSEHRDQALATFIEVTLARRSTLEDLFAVERDSLGIVHVRQSSERFQRARFERRVGGGRSRPAGVAAQSRPASAAVNVLESMIVAIKELAELSTVRLRAEIGDERCPARTANGRPEVVEHDLTTLAVKVDGAPGRQKREVGCDLVDDWAATGVNDRLQPIFEAKFATVLADQVDDREVTLAGSAAQAASKLLGEYRR